MAECNAYTLSEIVDKYFITRQISKKKYYAAYLSIAKDVWQSIFRNTLWEVQSQWMTMQRGDPYNFVYVPEGVSRLLSVAVEDRCGLIQPLFYNSQLNIISKPATKKCGCKSDCQCGGVCEAANSMTYTTKLLFTVDSEDYYEKTWRQLCPNGDVLEYIETPTKQYDNVGGEGTEFTVVTVTSQKKICKLEVLPCGCPVESEANECLLTETCGCNLNWNCGTKRRHCREYFENVDNNHFGTIKLSECGTKIYYKPSPQWKKVTDREVPEFLLVNWQSNGLLPNSQVMVPDYALNTMQTGIHWQSIRFNTAMSQVEKQGAYYQHEMEVANLIGYLNPISLIELGKVQDVAVRW